MNLERLGSLGHEDKRPDLVLAALVVGVCAYLAFAGNLLRDGDTGWHLAAGRYIFATRSVPVVDPFSYTFGGQPWHAHEWLSELIFAVAYRLAAWRGIILVSVGAAGATLLILARQTFRWLPARWAVCLCLVVCLLLRPLALARPHMLVWPLLAGWLVILLRARDERRAPPAPALLIMPLWANLHASYVLGLGILAALTVEALLAREQARAWLIFAVGAAVAACLGPLLLGGMAYAFQVSGMRVLPLIDEWRPANLHDDRLFVTFLLCCWVLAVLRFRRIHPVRLLLLGGLSAMALLHARHQMMFVITALLLLAPLLREREITREWRWPASLIPFGLLALLILMLPFCLRDGTAYPMTALGRLPHELRTRPVLNGYSFGGPMIMMGYRPYIDGRADMYGDAFTIEYIAMLRGDMARFRRAEQRWGFIWTILPPDAGLIARLDRSPAWRRYYADHWAVVHIRRSLRLDRLRAEQD